MHLLTGPRDPHEYQPPLLLELIRPVDAPFVRQDAILHGDEVDNGKLEPLGRVEGHEGDAISTGIPGVGICHECRGLEKPTERVPVFPGDLRVRDKRLVKLPRGRYEFLDVGQPFKTVFIVISILRFRTASRL